MKRVIGILFLIGLCAVSCAPNKSETTTGGHPPVRFRDGIGNTYPSVVFVSPYNYKGHEYLVFVNTATGAGMAVIEVK